MCSKFLCLLLLCFVCKESSAQTPDLGWLDGLTTACKLPLSSVNSCTACTTGECGCLPTCAKDASLKTPDCSVDYKKLCCQKATCPEAQTKCECASLCSPTCTEKQECVQNKTVAGTVWKCKDKAVDGNQGCGGKTCEANQSCVNNVCTNKPTESNCKAWCLNNGKCEGDKCVCAVGFTGDRCQKAAKAECVAGTHCSGHGTCKETGGCTCLEGWTGAKCDSSKEGACANKCKQGKCYIKDNSAKCNCTQGFTGDDCSAPVGGLDEQKRSKEGDLAKDLSEKCKTTKCNDIKLTSRLTELSADDLKKFCGSECMKELRGISKNCEGDATASAELVLALELCRKPDGAQVNGDTPADTCQTQLKTFRESLQLLDTIADGVSATADNVGTMQGKLCTACSNRLATQLQMSYAKDTTADGKAVKYLLSLHDTLCSAVAKDGTKCFAEFISLWNNEEMQGDELAALGTNTELLGKVCKSQCFAAVAKKWSVAQDLSTSSSDAVKSKAKRFANMVSVVCTKEPDTSSKSCMADFGGNDYVIANCDKFKTDTCCNNMIALLVKSRLEADKTTSAEQKTAIKNCLPAGTSAEKCGLKQKTFAFTSNLLASAWKADDTKKQSITAALKKDLSRELGVHTDLLTVELSEVTTTKPKASKNMPLADDTKTKVGATIRTQTDTAGQEAVELAEKAVKDGTLTLTDTTATANVAVEAFAADSPAPSSVPVAPGSVPGAVPATPSAPGANGPKAPVVPSASTPAAPTPTSSSSSSEEDDDDDSNVLLYALIGGGVAVVVLAVALIAFFISRNNKKKRAAAAQGHNGGKDNPLGDRASRYQVDEYTNSYSMSQTQNYDEEASYGYNDGGSAGSD